MLLACTRIAASEFISPWTAGWSAVINGQQHGVVFNGEFVPFTSDGSGDLAVDQETDILPREDEAATFVTQYIAQDELGQISFGYAHPGQAATNYRDAWGNQFGNWAFTTPEGKQIIVAYVADDQGYRAFSEHLPIAPTILIEAPTETVEVAAARAQHLASHQEIKNRPDMAPPTMTPSTQLPQSVTDTPEVALARAEFMKVFSEVKSRTTTTIA